MSQTRRMSLLESCTNIAIGYLVALASQLIVFPLFGVKADLAQNLGIGLVFTVVSLGRSYLLRRWFNRRGQ